MKHIHTYILFESVKRQKELDKLAITIIDYASNLSSKYYVRDNQNSSEDFSIYHDLHIISISELLNLKLIKKKDYSEDMIRFFKEYNLRIFFHEESTATKGYFDDQYRRVVVNIDDESLNELNNEIKDNINYTNVYYAVRTMLKKHSVTLVHELQHAWDNWISKGKYIDKNFSVANTKLNKEKDYSDYYKLSHEINARFAEVIYKLKNDGIKIPSEYGNPVSAPLNWSNFLRAFKSNFKGWDLIKPEQQERLIKRLSSEYSDMIKDKAPSINIGNLIKDKAKEFEAQGAEITIHYIHDHNQIRIYSFLAKNENQEREIMEDIVKIAETYRKVITLSPSKGHTGILLKTFVPMLKELGFVGNGGKFGTKKDFKFMDNMIRIPKRKYKQINHELVKAA